MKLGDIIGTGEFGYVLDIVDIQDTFETFGESLMSRASSGGDDPLAVKEAFKNVMQRKKRRSRKNLDDFPAADKCNLRTYMSERCYRGGIARFAVKRVRNDLNPVSKCMAIADLALEAKFLACMDHSNIIRMRATVGSPGEEDFFIFLDSLYCILDEKIKMWNIEVKKCLAPMKLCVLNRERHTDLMTERVMALFDIARALKHLHGKR